VKTLDLFVWDSPWRRRRSFRVGVDVDDEDDDEKRQTAFDDDDDD
jgi:hypothetical protein